MISLQIKIVFGSPISTGKLAPGDIRDIILLFGVPNCGYQRVGMTSLGAIFVDSAATIVEATIWLPVLELSRDRLLDPYQPVFILVGFVSAFLWSWN